MMWVWVLLLQAVTYTFNPYSIRTIEYRPKDAREMEDGKIAYKRVMVTFGEMVVLKPGEKLADKVEGEAPKMNPDSDEGTFSYKPKDCSPMHDLRERWVCVDRDWGKKPPSIWWAPKKRVE